MARKIQSFITVVVVVVVVRPSFPPLSPLLCRFSRLPLSWDAVEYRSCRPWVLGWCLKAWVLWTRRRTSAVTAVHLAAIAPRAPHKTRPGAKRSHAAMSGNEVLEEPELMSMGIGQRGRRSGVKRAVDGPLPTLAVWLETDNDTPLTPPADSITLDITTPGSSG